MPRISIHLLCRLFILAREYRYLISYLCKDGKISVQSCYGWGVARNSTSVSSQSVNAAYIYTPALSLVYSGPCYGWGVARNSTSVSSQSVNAAYISTRALSRVYSGLNSTSVSSQSVNAAYISTPALSRVYSSLYYGFGLTRDDTSEYFCLKRLFYADTSMDTLHTESGAELEMRTCDNVTPWTSLSLSMNEPAHRVTCRISPRWHSFSSARARTRAPITLLNYTITTLYTVSYSSARTSEKDTVSPTVRPSVL
ncbi:hypothetical protein J6590_034677 [Homalodisca vitripennis]|nr:hypothetical protein J6590_034677 [Homalodisca vitripennis]